MDSTQPDPEAADLYQNTLFHTNRVKWTPYGFVGIAAFMHNPQALAPATDLNGNPLALAMECEPPELMSPV